MHPPVLGHRPLMVCRHDHPLVACAVEPCHVPMESNGEIEEMEGKDAYMYIFNFAEKKPIDD
jgi:hypothetical protein